MKILMVTSKTNDNPVIKREVKSFKDSGYDIEVLECDREPCSTLRLFYDMLKYYYRLIRLIPKKKFDIIHVHDMHAILICLLLGKIMNKKVVYDVHDIYYYHRRCENILSFIDLMMAKYCDLIIVPCKDYEYYFRNVTDKIVQIYNAPDPNVYKSSGIKHKHFVITYLGTVRDIKPFKVLFEASYFIPDVRIVISGIRIDNSPIVKLAKKYKNVTILPRTNEKGVLKRYNKSDCIFVVYPDDNTAIVHSVPMKVFESMSFGLPVITNWSGNTGKFVRQHIIGATVKNINSIEDIYTAIRIVMEFKNECGKRGRFLVEHFYNWKNQEIKIIRAYGRMLK
jgi:glycosyltransferase involved in cell wall biosynthesis